MQLSTRFCRRHSWIHDFEKKRPSANYYRFQAGEKLTSGIFKSRRSGDGYNAASIEVLKDLEPVKRRPGMYTDTTRPNHLAQEIIDNSVDEAIGGDQTRRPAVCHRL
jgi:hypothetical protein